MMDKEVKSLVQQISRLVNEVKADLEEPMSLHVVNVGEQLLIDLLKGNNAGKWPINLHKEELRQSFQSLNISKEEAKEEAKEERKEEDESMEKQLESS